MKKVLLALLIALLVVAGVVVVRGIAFASRQVHPEPLPPAMAPEGTVARLSQALTYPTVSHGDPEARDDAAFEAFHVFLEGAFPRVHGSLDRESPGGHSLLFTWPGSRPDLRPVILLAHMDVVPVEPGTEEEWTHPPFAGRVADGYVWGRGAMDDKAGLMAILEAAELLLEEGFRPARTFYLAFGHDEEVGGFEGARRTAELLRERGVEPALVVDEGGVIAVGMLEGVDRPVALVGIGEKGYANLELAVRGEGGHSSMPPREPAVAVLGRALWDLSRNPMPPRLGPAAPTFEHLAPEMGLLPRILFANRWLFGPLIRRQLSRDPATDALIRTTTAPTMLQGSAKENVLPVTARGLVNVRLLPGDSVAHVVAHARRAVGSDRVHVRLPPESVEVEAPPVSPAAGPTFEMMTRTLRQTYPEALVAPYLLFGATDSRWFTYLTPHIYRMRHLRIGPEDRARIHGTDERVAVEDHERGIGFWRQLILNADGMESE